MINTLKQLRKNYPDSIITEETDKSRIEKTLTPGSKPSVNWGAGFTRDGWVLLASYSPQSKGDKSMMIFCRESKVPVELKGYLIHYYGN